MPRGNLEGIFPRMLSLSVVKDMLDQHEYQGAFTLMRNHRIDLNLIYDHNPQDFLSVLLLPVPAPSLVLSHSVGSFLVPLPSQRVEDFVKQVERVDYLNLFLSSLNEEDVTTTLFATVYKRNNVPGAENNKPQASSKTTQGWFSARRARLVQLSLLTSRSLLSTTRVTKLRAPAAARLTPCATRCARPCGLLTLRSTSFPSSRPTRFRSLPPWRMHSSSFVTFEVLD